MANGVTEAARTFRRRWALCLGGVVAALVGGYVGLGLSLPTVAGTEVCTRSGVVRLYGVYQLPWTAVVLRRASSILPTPVSLVLARHGVHQGGPHTFELMQQSDDQPLGGRGCTVGPATNVFVAVRSADVAGFLDALLTWGDRPTAERWVDRTLSDGTAARVPFAVLMTPPPPAGFADRATFQSWWRSAEPRYEDAMATP